jgi:hypothetical protein
MTTHVHEKRHAPTVADNRCKAQYATFVTDGTKCLAAGKEIQKDEADRDDSMTHRNEPLNATRQKYLNDSKTTAAINRKTNFSFLVCRDSVTSKTRIGCFSF